MSTMRFLDLPEDMQVLIEQLVLDDDPDAWIPKELPIALVPVSCFPDIPLSDADRGTAYALEIDPAQAPPLLVANGHFLDGKHRVYSALARGIPELLVMDLSGFLRMENAEENSMGKVIGLTSEVGSEPSGFPCR